MKKMKMLTKDQIIAVQDAKVTMEDVPEWGGAVGIKIMTGAERDAYACWIGDNMNAIRNTREGKTNMKMALLSRTLCDEGGTLLFTMEDLQVLAMKSGIVLNRLNERAMFLNGLNEPAKESIRKNSEAPSGETGSDSPAVSESPSQELSGK